MHGQQYIKNSHVGKELESRDFDYESRQPNPVRATSFHFIFDLTSAVTTILPYPSVSDYVVYKLLFFQFSAHFIVPRNFFYFSQCVLHNLTIRSCFIKTPH